MAFQCLWNDRLSKKGRVEGSGSVGGRRRCGGEVLRRVNKTRFQDVVRRQRRWTCKLDWRSMGLESRGCFASGAWIGGTVGYLGAVVWQDLWRCPRDRTGDTKG